MPLLLTGQAADVALGEPGGHQRQRDGREPVRPLPDQFGDGLAERLRGRFDEAAGDGQPGIAAAQLPYKLRRPRRPLRPGCRAR